MTPPRKLKLPKPAPDSAYDGFTVYHDFAFGGYPKGPPRTIKELRKRLPKGWTVGWWPKEKRPCVHFILIINDCEEMYEISNDYGYKDSACYPAALALAEAVETRK